MDGAAMLAFAYLLTLTCDLDGLGSSSTTELSAGTRTSSSTRSGSTYDNVVNYMHPFVALYLQLLEDVRLDIWIQGAFVALALAGKVLRAKIRPKPRLPPPPPGPPGHWLSGTPPPRANQYQQFAEWINTYGHVISLRIGPKIMVIIGRHQESVDMMRKQGGLLAGRPCAVAAGEILSRGLRSHKASLP
ncbi:uncharacterized protein EDB91DRAFT_1079874 [Suillus paluster]|uniref:uncharacterized protein n=1 Tax=Suillus paluster TaxID=48578 RepID=UPI001B88613B|nr:uncharacterized protein EDB91DRAFT_1079874 [Suillus paluster]KAG1746521.1 hypothetical protein EDB91DRAFT_1079874 [Suillus paluster]